MHTKFQTPTTVPSWKVDSGRNDGRTDGQTDRSSYRGGAHPKIELELCFLGPFYMLRWEGLASHTPMLLFSSQENEDGRIITYI